MALSTGACSGLTIVAPRPVVVVGGLLAMRNRPAVYITPNNVKINTCISDLSTGSQWRAKAVAAQLAAAPAFSSGVKETCVQRCRRETPR